MSERLYELTAQYREALDNVYVDTETGEVVGGLELDALEGAINDKAEAIAVVIKEKMNFANACKAEIDSITKKQKTTLKEVDFLKEYLKTNLEALNIPKVQTPRTTISFRTSTSVEVTDESKLPKQFIIEKTTYSPDKVALKELLNSGATVDGACLRTSKNIQIK